MSKPTEAVVDCLNDFLKTYNVKEWFKRKASQIMPVKGKGKPKKLDLFLVIWLTWASGDLMQSDVVSASTGSVVTYADIGKSLGRSHWRTPREQIRILYTLQLINKSCLKAINSLLNNDSKWILPATSTTSPISATPRRCVRLLDNYSREIWRKGAYPIDLGVLQPNSHTYILNLWIAYQVFLEVKKSIKVTTTTKTKEESKRTNVRKRKTSSSTSDEDDDNDSHDDDDEGENAGSDPEWTVEEFVDQQLWGLIRSNQNRDSGACWSLREPDGTSDEEAVCRIVLADKFLIDCQRIQQAILSRAQSYSRSSMNNVSIEVARALALEELECVMFKLWIEEQTRFIVRTRTHSYSSSSSSSLSRKNCTLMAWSIWVHESLNLLRPLCSQLHQQQTNNKKKNKKKNLSFDLLVDVATDYNKRKNIYYLRAVAFARSHTLGNLKLFCAGCSAARSEVVAYPLTVPHHCKKFPTWATNGEWIHWLNEPLKCSFPVTDLYLWTKYGLPSETQRNVDRNWSCLQWQKGILVNEEKTIRHHLKQLEFRQEAYKSIAKLDRASLTALRKSKENWENSEDDPPEEDQKEKKSGQKQQDDHDDDEDITDENLINEKQKRYAEIIALFQKKPLQKVIKEEGEKQKIIKKEEEEGKSKETESIRSTPKIKKRKKSATVTKIKKSTTSTKIKIENGSSSSGNKNEMKPKKPKKKKKLVHHNEVRISSRTRIPTDRYNPAKSYG